MGLYKWNSEPKKIYIRVNEIIHVTWISLNKNILNLTTAWDTEQLTATITPANADDQTITWSSSDTNVATVDQTWLVTCVTPWTANITVTTNDWGYTASCYVTDNPIPYIVNANTMLYIPFETDTNDYSWHSYNITNNWVTIATVGGVNAWYFTRNYLQIWDNANLRWADGYTWCVWYKYTSGMSTACDMVNKGRDSGANSILLRILGGTYQCWINNSTFWFNQVTVSDSRATDNDWHNVILTYASTTETLYIDWVQVWTNTTNPNFTNYDTMYIWCFSGSQYWFKWYMAQIIFENQLWSWTDVANYYTNTKRYFGL